MWALGWWPRAADDLTEVAKVAERNSWQLGRGTSQGTEKEKKKKGDTEQQEQIERGGERGDIGRDALGRDRWRHRA